MEENVRRQQQQPPCRRVRLLLWNEIAALLNPGERDVVRKSIGAGLIDNNEVLFREAVAYEEILQFVDEDMQRQIASHKILESPALQMLEKEIKSLVQHIQGCSDENASSIFCTEADDSRTEASVALSVRSHQLISLRDLQFKGEAGCDPLCNRGNLLVQLHGKCGSVDDACVVFDSTPQCNGFTWNSMVTAYTQNGYLLQAKAVFNNMPQITPVTCTVMITAFSKQGYLNDAKIIYNESVSRDLALWNALLTAFAENGEWMCAKDVLDGAFERVC